MGSELQNVEMHNPVSISQMQIRLLIWINNWMFRQQTLQIEGCSFPSAIMKWIQFVQERLLYLYTIHGRVCMECIAIFHDLAIHLSSLPLSKSKQPCYVQIKDKDITLKEQRKGQAYSSTQSRGSPEFPFNSLWFSSLVLPSLSLMLNGSNVAAAIDLSGNSAE